MLKPSPTDSALVTSAFQGPESAEGQPNVVFIVFPHRARQAPSSEGRLITILLKAGSFSSNARFVLEVLQGGIKASIGTVCYCSGVTANVYSNFTDRQTSYQEVGEDPKIWDSHGGDGRCLCPRLLHRETVLMRADFG